MQYLRGQLPADDNWVERISARGIEPAEEETYGNGVRKVIYRDPMATRLASAAPRSSDRIITAESDDGHSVGG